MTMVFGVCDGDGGPGPHQGRLADNFIERSIQSTATEAGKEEEEAMIAKEERVDTVRTRLYSFRNRPPPLTERKGFHSLYLRGAPGTRIAADLSADMAQVPPNLHCQSIAVHRRALAMESESPYARIE
jgi:hypothetical protein